MQFVIRDDDLNYFSQPADIDRWYADIFAEGIPVGFSAIPLVKPASDVYTGDVQAEDREYPVSENGALTTYVKGNPLIEILQHGTTHDSSGGYEYSKKSGLEKDTQRGKKELQKAFGDKFRNVFVPPHDWIGSQGVRAVEAAGMDVIRGRGAGLRNWIPRWPFVRIFFKMLWFRVIRAFHGDALAYPHVLDFGRHQEVCSYRLEDTDVFEGLRYAHQENGLFVVVVHLHFFTDEKKARLRELIERARSLGAEFVAPSVLFV